MSKCIAAALLTLLVAAPFAAAAATSKTDYQAAHTQALAAHEKAASVDNQWTTTEKVLTAAQAAAKNGDYEQATALANKAQALAQLAVEQAKTQAQAWKNAVVR